MKASAGTAFHCEILKAPDTVSAVRLLKANGWHICGLDARGDSQLYRMVIPKRTVWIFGNESTGLSADVKPLIDEWVNIPMAQVESLNVAMSATLVAFENVCRQLT